MVADDVVGDDLGRRHVGALGEQPDAQAQRDRGRLHHAGELSTADDGEVWSGHGRKPIGTRKPRRSLTVIGERLPKPAQRTRRQRPRVELVAERRRRSRASTSTRLLRATCDSRAARLTGGP